MQRVTQAPRADWRARAESLGFSFHTIAGEPYWTEDAAYAFTSAEIDALEEATGALEQMCLQAVDRVVKEGWYDRFGLDDTAAQLVDASWRRFDKNLYGRFDLSLRPGEPPKLLEYNADTPTALFEASVVQWEWLQTVYPAADQFNSIHEKLIESWRRFELPGAAVHFACVRDHDEDRATTDYLRDTAMQAGLDTRFLFMDEIGWDGTRFRDVDDQEIDALFKLYPWEWMMRESFAAHIDASGTQLIEPPWKMLLSNKTILALLWHLFPDHPNLLPAGLEPEDVDGPVVRKPRLGREGANIAVIDRPGAEPPATEGPYGAEGFVYQAHWPLPEFGGRYPVIGSWVIASQPAGIGIREDDTAITKNTSRFVPHFFT